MATQSSRDSVETNYAAQAAIAAALGTALSKLTPTIDPTRLGATLPVFTKAATVLVQQHASASRGLAVKHYADVRKHAGITEPYRPPLTSLPPVAQVDATIKWATDGLWSTEGGALPTTDDLQVAESKVAAGLEKAVLDTGRNQLIEATRQDRLAIAWAREARPDACWFCSMLATRGAIYTSAEAAGLAKPTGGQMPVGLDARGEEWVNRYHDHCKCQVVPVFTVYEPTAHVREWQALWNKTMRPSGGKPITGMNAMQSAWREAFAEWQKANR